MMDLDFDKLFTHKIILESSEPGLVIEAGTSAEIHKKDVNIAFNLRKSHKSKARKIPPTWTGLLEEGCIRNYNETPQIKELDKENDEFGIMVLVGTWKEVGYASNKTDAKHIASRRVLDKIIDDGKFTKFGIPGETAEKARLFIEEMMPELSNEEVHQANTGNYYSKVLTLCEKENLGILHFDDTETGPPHQKTFRCTAMIGESISATAESKRKKDAKNLALMRLYGEMIN